MSYTRVNWNSTTTYVSADNLNIMDKGIKDLDTNIGDVTTLTTTAKTVVPAIKELKTGLEALNNNLTNLIAPQRLTWIDQITHSGSYVITLNDSNKVHFPTQNQSGDSYIILALVSDDYATLLCSQIGYSRFSYNTLTLSTKSIGSWRVLE